MIEKRRTSGHFGHPPESGGNAFTWERTSEADLAALLHDLGGPEARVPLGYRTQVLIARRV